MIRIGSSFLVGAGAIQILTIPPPKLRFDVVLRIGDGDGNVENQNLHSETKIRLDRIASCRESSAREIHLFGNRNQDSCHFSRASLFLV